MTNIVLLHIIFSHLLLLLGSSSSSSAPGVPRRSKLANVSNSPSPTTFFEVRRPIPVPNSPPCSLTYLQHDFNNTEGQPPITVPYYFPPHCSPNPSIVVLEWSATCSEFQYGRIFGVWLSGVELLRSCTARPPTGGVRWSVRKDVTRYASLFSKPQNLSVYVSNIVNNFFLGIYHAKVSIHFYYGPRFLRSLDSADLVIPISRSLPLADGHWFRIRNSTDLQGRQVALPRNAYRAVLEVFISFDARDWTWYTHPPNSYISANNITNQSGNGAFREVRVKLDGKLVGAVWPFTVIYNGGFDHRLWSPISGIGSFDLPSYDLEITPFLGEILDGKKHFFEFGVANALDAWLVDANLHLWLDGSRSFTRGGLLAYTAPAFGPYLVSSFQGLDGYFNSFANRKISSMGWVESSRGNITTQFIQKFNFTNKIKYTGNGSIKEVKQKIELYDEVHISNSSLDLYSKKLIQSFPLYLLESETKELNNETTFRTNVSLGFNVNKTERADYGFSVEDLTNSQTAHAFARANENNITSFGAITKQVYIFKGTDGCYYRNVGSDNRTILFDKIDFNCANI